MSSEPAKDELFPEIEPYDSGYLRVSDIHEIYYEQSGNPQGKPVFFLHGGPGGSAAPGPRRYYDPKKFRIVLHDQRGAGRSRPFAELRENTTQDLVEDIERLRRHLKIEDKILIVGGSWGSTLALAYAEAHPERVAGMVLRGIYLGTPEEMERFYGHGVATYFPEVSERLWSQVPEMPGKTRPQRLLALLESPDPEVRKKIARAWAAYETKVAFLERSDADVEAAFADLRSHRLLADREPLHGQGLLPGARPAPARRRQDQGHPGGHHQRALRRDLPAEDRLQLHKALPKSQLWIVEAAGHAGSEPGIQAALVRAVRSFEPVKTADTLSPRAPALRRGTPARQRASPHRTPSRWETPPSRSSCSTAAREPAAPHATPLRRSGEVPPHRPARSAASRAQPPFRADRENTTQALVEDVERLRQHLKIKRMILLGGSWGSTLALAYAEAYPDHVAGLILRGIFLGTREEMDLYFPRSVGDYFPEVYERFCAQIPEMPGKSLAERVFALLESPDEEVRRNAARAWVEFELKTVGLQRTDEEVRQELGTFDPEALARLKTFYIVRDCFLEEGQLLRDIGRIQHIPAILLNGRYDLMTPPVVAWKLHKALPKSELWLIEAAGHSAGEPATQEGLVRAVRKFE